MSKREQYKATFGILLVMIGVAQYTAVFVDFYPAYTGGLIALLGGIYIVDRVEAAAEVSA